MIGLVKAMCISWLLRKFKEYEQYCTGDAVDRLEWRGEFMEFVIWLSEKEA